MIRYKFINKTFEGVLDSTFYKEVMEGLSWEAIPSLESITFTCQNVTPFIEDNCVNREFETIDGTKVVFSRNSVLPSIESLLKPIDFDIVKGWNTHSTINGIQYTMIISPATFSPKKMLFNEWGISKDISPELSLYSKLAWNINEKIRNNVEITDSERTRLVFFAISNTYFITPHLLNEYDILNQDWADLIYSVALDRHRPDEKKSNG